MSDSSGLAFRILNNLRDEVLVGLATNAVTLRPILGVMNTQQPHWDLYSHTEEYKV